MPEDLLWIEEQAAVVIWLIFSNMGTDGARKTNNVSRKKREVSNCFSSLSEGRDSTGNSFGKMISQGGQISSHDDLSPLVFEG
jgi:hypothetical protein